MYLETVGLAADCLIDCVLRTVLTVASAAAAPGVWATPEAAAAAAGSNSSRATAQRVGPLCCRLLQQINTQVKGVLLLHISRANIRPEAAAATTAADGDSLLQLLLRQDAQFVARDKTTQQQQQQSAAAAPPPPRAEEFCPLLQVAAALQQILEADVLFLLRHAATQAMLLQQAFPDPQHRFVLLCLNPFLGGAPVGARREIFATLAAAAETQAAASAANSS